MIFFGFKFKKRYKKFDKKIRDKIDLLIPVFENNVFDERLHNHALHGEWVGYRSIDVTGDIRIIYIQLGETITFITVGTHSELYG